MRVNTSNTKIARKTLSRVKQCDIGSGNYEKPSKLAQSYFTFYYWPGMERAELKWND